MDVTSFILGVVGTIVSIVSYFKAKSAKEAVDAVVERHSNQQNYDSLNALLQKLNEAKNAAKRRRSNAPQFISSGYNLEMDLHLLQEAEDVLRTGLPLEFRDKVAVDLSGAADELIKAIGDTQLGNSRDGWQDALSTLQNIIPRLEQAAREFRVEGMVLTARA
ncbi:hypothetical protein FDX19_02610 [Citrobacter sp. wls619]|uniref:hypothetical protein n=1 Tax=Citrobacter sp. wls619 TaxID=2576432 RepID=UPI0010CA15F2|nr:hypothetical protein [Citrobacter sp. wls619]TKV13247.1 hypothetical protein FDX19_02610 [Citrobacter sp. wls619]